MCDAALGCCESRNSKGAVLDRCSCANVLPRSRAPHRLTIVAAASRQSADGLGFAVACLRQPSSPLVTMTAILVWWLGRLLDGPDGILGARQAR